MKFLIYSGLVILLFSCAQSSETEYLMADMEVSGEFLFEGPNSLQGKLKNPMENISKEKGIDPAKIQSIYLKSCTVEFPDEESQSIVENILVQVVSDQLNLVSVATINGIPESSPISIPGSAEQDILPYLKDQSSMLVLDANLKNDVDVLKCSVDFTLKILYNN